MGRDMEIKVSTVQKKILTWYGRHHRDLPWRSTRDPYQILVSEVMLQQTQVDRVIPKYLAFLREFPDVGSLAAAPTAAVIRAWAGLGYNRRALYLQRTAQTVVHTFHGKFPLDREVLKTLPGIGDYTARAIAAFAFEEAVPMMDTNHRRFYQRVFFGLNLKKDAVLLQKAETVFPRRQSFAWNQALMDFGSLVCLTGRPTCEICPIQKYCLAYPKILKQPVTGKKKKKKATVPFRQTDRFFRGRIIDLLREHQVVQVATIIKLYPELTNERLHTIIFQLEKDGLIKRKKSTIVLP